MIPRLARTGPLPLELIATVIAQLKEPDDEHAVSTSVYVFVLVLACCGGALHGIAMAIKKKYGEGHEKYWLEWKWWVGTVADGFAGFMIWPAMPYVSVAILVPSISVVQIGSSYILGMVVFGEKCVMMHNIGLFFAIAGVIGVGLSTSHEAAHFTISDFWSRFVTERFLGTTFGTLMFLACSFFGVHRSTFWALSAAAFEGIQYICSRAIVDSIFEKGVAFLMQPAVVAALILKTCCILGIIHTTQLGLDTDLSRFAGIYLVACVMFMCVCGWAFFGDAMPLTIRFGLSALSTLLGIWLLNQKQKEEIKADGDAKIEQVSDGQVPQLARPVS